MQRRYDPDKIHPLTLSMYLPAHTYNFETKQNAAEDVPDVTACVTYKHAPPLDTVVLSVSCIQMEAHIDAHKTIDPRFRMGHHGRTL